MSIESTRERTVTEFRPSGWLWALCVAAMLIGIAAAVVGFKTVNPLHTWLWLVVWFLFVGSLAQGMLCWSAVFRVAQAGWTPAINRLGHSVIGYLPISFLVMIFLLVGVREWVPWTHAPVPEKAAWLNIPFMVIRDVICVFGLGVLDFVLVRWSLIADARSARGEAISDREHWRLTAVAVATVFAYVLAFTILSYDFIMSLSPEWYSTMFAPYYWITTVYASMAAIVITGALLRRRLGVVGYLGLDQFNDMGNLMLGFSLFSMGLFFAQYLTIWYGNLPEETSFLIDRYMIGPWPWTAWTAFVLAYAVPFILLQSRMLKRSPFWLSVVSVILLVGVALERYVLVVPSVIGISHVGMSLVPAFSALFFVGALGLTMLGFLRRYQPYSAADAELKERQRQEVVAP